MTRSNMLGLPEGASTADIKRAYRLAGRTKHPDVGGNPDEWAKITAYYEHALKYGVTSIDDKYSSIVESMNSFNSVKYLHVNLFNYKME